ncbi:zinc ribbon domain-containing protein [Xylophilus ampelinus]|uniref:Putative FmdB family regulatory protein n=1 Tax=Xylophilus ampelinus TaxID=54067 RepID=A0A318SSS6_9BURK|nr:zinc ribbon domain-containing protein [Xylophilus ampelinus]MCS4510679.1 zinc ribbon domain-containing protein [Xylophilus ampelinus]PYE76369.1 putative FmdB family regulatory protein [Xylophilus ampelinus]
MPTYDYQCAACGGFDAIRSLALRNEPAACPGCSAASPRVFASAPRLACISPDQRRAFDTNERAQHAPRSSRNTEQGSYGRMRHPAGCGCCSTAAGKRGATVTGANGAKAFPTKRPWMISH